MIISREIVSVFLIRLSKKIRDSLAMSCYLYVAIFLISTVLCFISVLIKYLLKYEKYNNSFFYTKYHSTYIHNVEHMHRIYQARLNLANYH